MSTKENSNRYVKAFCYPGAIWALVWVAFQLWMVIHGSYSAMVTRAIHTCFGMGMVFLNYPMLKKNRAGKGQAYFPKWYDYIPFAITVASGIYILFNADRYGTRMAYVDPLTTLDYVVAIALLVLLVECSRRAVNLALTIIVLIFIAYGFWGQYLPGLLSHGTISFARFIEAQIYSTSGVFGSPVSVACGTVFYFLLFGAFLTATPAGQLFVNISSLLTRRTNGGAGKATVVASALFGMISGSAPGNVASIGTIMYEPMKRQGFDNRFTGSILAIGGTAGQLIPPVMGAAAFIMVDMAGIPYSTIMLAAILPSFVFMAALYILIDLYARKNHLNKPEIDPKACRREIGQHLHLLLSVVVLVWLILRGQSMMSACSAATLTLIALCMLRKDTRLTLFGLIQTLVNTGRQAVIVTMPCAVAGIIVGQITVTGLGVRFSSMINALASNSLLLALVATMLMALVLGMGVPTAAAYILAATLLCPSLIKLGAPVIAAHFFVFYFANLSMITPPVALSSFTAAGIVGDNMWKLGLSAFKYSFIIFLIPFTFVYNPAMLGIGSVAAVTQTTLTCLIGAMGLGMALIGYGFCPISLPERIIAVAAAVCLVVPGTVTDIIGIVVLAVLLAVQLKTQKNRSTAITERELHHGV